MYYEIIGKRGHSHLDAFNAGFNRIIIKSDLYLIPAPGKKDQTFTETSVLLKYPYLYFAILFAVYLGGFYMPCGQTI